MQRISTALMQGMAACIHDRLDSIRRDRTSREYREFRDLDSDGSGHSSLTWTQTALATVA